MVKESEYVNEAKRHMQGDEKVKNDDVKEMENYMNSEARAWKRIFNIGSNWNSQTKRVDAALKTNNCKPNNPKHLYKPISFTEL